MRKKIIIGATGYIGSQLLMKANLQGAAFGTTSHLANSALMHLNLIDPIEFAVKFFNPGDTLFITAAISAPDICKKEKKQAWEINVEGTTKLIDAATTKGARIIFFSSDTVYGENLNLFDEKSPCNPVGEYAEMKQEVEKRFYESSAFKTIRLSYVFSNEDKFTRYLAECEKKNEEAELFHPFQRAIIHREDVIEGALALCDKWEEFPEKIINFGGPQIMSRIEFAECLRKTCLTNLKFRVTQPDREFFQNRPSIIAMTSPILEKLLGRPAREIHKAATLEFNPNKQ